MAGGRGPLSFSSPRIQKLRSSSAFRQGRIRRARTGRDFDNYKFPKNPYRGRVTTKPTRPRLRPFH